MIGDSKDLGALWRQAKVRLRNDVEYKADLKIGLAGSFTMDSLIPYIGGHLLTKDMSVPNFVTGPYNQIHQLCFDFKNFFGTDELDYIVVLWRLEDLLPGLLSEALGSRQSLAKLLEEVERIIQSISNLKSNFNGRIIISTPPYPSIPAFDVHNLGQSIAGGLLHNTIIEFFLNSITGIDGINILDLHGLLMSEGLVNAHDVRKFYLYHQPYRESFLEIIGIQIGREIAAQTISAKKCIVLDCDDTLWGGIVGEVGISGIQLGKDFPGSAYADFQCHLLTLHKKGVLLALASKNDEERVWDVFENHDGMQLKREHISAHEINWLSKVDGISRIAQKLNIGLDSLVFVDDSSKEVGEVRERLPEVACFLVPEEIAYLPGLLRNTDLFDITEVTDEDKNRAQMLAADEVRTADFNIMSEEEFKASLNLKVNVFEAQPQHMARVVQLINKTNQFNLTTVRRSQIEVERLAKDENVVLLAVEINDRYGDYGLVGVAILVKDNEANRLNIDSLLMSCRVLGRDAETAFIAKIADVAKIKGVEELSACYFPTPKNNLVKDLYDLHGFTFCESTHSWIAKLSDIPSVPTHIEASLTLS